MASVREVSSFTEDLLCPICLCIFRDPHMLECGHSFCAPCLEPCIPKGQRRGLCPECRRPFALRRMAVNRALCNLAEKARLLKLDEGPQLAGTGGWYFCEEHEEPLKLFCSQDEGPVCVICRDLPQHRGHDFLPIKNAVQAYQDQLKASLEPLEEGLRRLKMSQCRQQENIIELKTCSESLSDHMSGEFVKMHQLLTERELSLKEALENQREKNLAQMEAKLKELNWKVASWSETLCRVRTGLECRDHISFLKEAKELLDSAGKAKEEQNGVVVVMNRDVSCCPVTHLRVKLQKVVQVTRESISQIVDQTGPACIMLDCNSAHPSLILVEEATGVKYSPGRRFWRRKPERFTSSPCVVGREGFTSGRFYWEIRVGDSTGWVVGVAKKSVKRKKRLDFRPKEGVWAIELKAGQYQALSEPRSPISVCGRMEKVGVYLDFEGGQLSFYNSSSTSHLYTFQVSFHEELLPLLSTQGGHPLSVWDLDL
ncbi:hypothetical protein JRQ81_003450 [Phrynocephalus forsythii]|uniref:Uncharacterized protein n=1 Tax=Phrynocephalus forsythii TaxID=171643 RepID=A0A9Q0XM32_9SAUR|nr:hypothetical protein JRQ81_003450 [Phrynocephalus forsythii]